MRRKILALAGAALLVTTSACGGDPSEDGGLTEITVGAIPIVDVAPIHLGKEQGFFEDHGIKLNIKPTKGGAESVPSTVNGDFDFAFGNITSLITAREKGLPVKIVSNGVTTTGVQGEDFGGVVVPEGSDIKSPKDLAGKEIAVNNLKNIGDTTVRNSVREDGGSSENIKFREFPFPEMPAALENGEIDAAWVVEPFLTTALKNGANEVTSNFVDTHKSLSIASYFTTEQQIAENPELVKSFRAAMHESMNYADGRPEEVRRILTTYTEMDDQLIEEIRLPNFPAEQDRKSAEKVGQLMKTDGLIKSEPNLDELFYQP